MTEDCIEIRIAVPSDVPRLVEIYTPYVERTAISFEYDVPGLEEFAGRLRRILAKHPYLVAVQNGEIQGYAYTGDFIGRAAYRFSAETTIYIRHECTKSGIGRRLYTVLERISAAQNILNLNACIGLPHVEDEYLTRNSVDFHEHMGFTTVGVFHNSGYKFGRWYDMVWMEKIIGKHIDACMAEVIPFPDLPNEVLTEAGVEL